MRAFLIGLFRCTTGLRVFVLSFDILSSVECQTKSFSITQNFRFFQSRFENAFMFKSFGFSVNDFFIFINLFNCLLL